MAYKKFLRMTIAAAALLALLPAALLSQQAAPKEDEGKLIAVLQSDADLFQKAKACQKLAVVGTKAAVPVLASLLSDEKLAHYARFGLEPIPDPSVDEALREALGKLQGKLLVGVVNSIGVRRDAKALPGLSKLAGGQDAEVAAAAAAAMGRIGSPAAARALREMLSSAPAALRPAVADACLPCAELLLAQGQRDEAVKVYDSLRQADLPPHIRASGLHGAIVARGAAGVALLAETLGGSDGTSFDLALGMVRDVKEEGMTGAVAAQLGKLTPARQALVLAALGDRGDKAALPAVLDVAKGGAAEARAAALRVLGKLGDASAVPVLLDAAAKQDDGAAGKAALEALEALGGKDVDGAIAAGLERSEGKLRAVLIDLAGRRGIAAAAPALRKAADDPDDRIRLAAVKALGSTVALGDLAFLIDRVVQPGKPQDAGAVQDALKAALKRLPDKDACAAKLGEALAKAPKEAKVRLLEALGAAGGAKALGLACACAREADEGIRDAALRVLGEWPSEDAAPELLGLVKASGDALVRGSALQSFRRVVSRLRFPKEQRLALCQEALGIARNDDERKVVLATLAAIPAAETLAILAPHMANPALKEDACAAAVTIGERLIRYQPAAVADSMKQVIQATGNKDLAERARKLIQQAGGKT